MALDSSPRPVTPQPQPGLIKTIGILNLLIGGVYLLGGSGCLILAAPTVLINEPLRIDPETTRAFFDEIRRQRIDDLSAREQASGTEGERARLRDVRRKVEAKRPRVDAQIDFPKVNSGLGWMTRYLGFDLSTGLALNLLLVVAGVGLVLKRNWARVLGLWTAALKLVRLIALAAFLIAVVIPRLGGTFDALLATEMGPELIAHVVDQQRARQDDGGTPVGSQPGRDEVVRMIRGFGIVSAISFVCVGSIYPLVALLLLSRPGARAACVSGARSDRVMPAG
jgi:hypothetical protein